MLCIRGTLSEGQACHPNQLDCFRETFRGKAFGAKDRWTCPSVPQAGRDRFIKQMNASAPRLSYRTHAKCTKAHISLIKFLVFPITHIRRALFLLTLGSFSARLAPTAERGTNRSSVPPCAKCPSAPKSKQGQGSEGSLHPGGGHSQSSHGGTWQVPVASGRSGSFPKSQISVFTRIHMKGDKPNAQENLPFKGI